MARSSIIESESQYSLYDPMPRKISIYFSIPDQINASTGFLIMLAGFGGNALSNVFIKMREQFADKYNLVTIQTNYFGWEYMQAEVKKESLSYFCDMGPVQAMDNLVALKVVKDYLQNNGLLFDDKNAIAYGFSHGAYLCHMMNVLMPGVLSTIVDNSGWITPAYLFDDRVLFGDSPIVFHYLIKDIVMDKDIYNLQYLYHIRGINKANVVAFHGVGDELSPITDKLMLALQNDRFSLEAIGEERIDNRRFKSITHGLNADFLEVFDYVIKRYKTVADESVLKFNNQSFETERCKYWIDVSSGIPQLFYDPLFEYDFSSLDMYK